MRENDANIAQSFTCSRFRLSDYRSLSTAEGMDRVELDGSRSLEGKTLVAANKVAV